MYPEGGIAVRSDVLHSPLSLFSSALKCGRNNVMPQTAVLEMERRLLYCFSYVVRKLDNTGFI